MEDTGYLTGMYCDDFMVPLDETIQLFVAGQSGQIAM